MAGWAIESDLRELGQPGVDRVTPKLLGEPGAMAVDAGLGTWPNALGGQRSGAKIGS